MKGRKIRILLGKLGHGHNEVMLNLAKKLGSAGFEVIYTELQDPEAIARAAVHESVDHIGITTLAGADTAAFQKIREELIKEDADHVTLTAGGILDEKEIPGLKAMGVMEFFPRGTSFDELVDWARENITLKAA
jgi:methylmalonyl-CoA mutase C-terminal domain/subunit